MNLTAVHKALILLVVWLLLTGGAGGSAAPFKTDKLAGVVIHDANDAANLPKWTDATDAKSVRAWFAANGGEFRTLGQDADNEFLGPQWKAALAVKRASLPWFVAATPKRGVSMPATDEAAVLSALNKMGAK